MARRRAKGTGSISWNERRKRWIARAPGDARVGYYPTREEAEATLTEWVRQLRAGVNLSDTTQPLHAFLETWLTRKAATVRPSTLEFYQRHCEYIVAYIGRTPLDRLTTIEIEMMFTKLANDGLSPRSVHHVRSVLSNALKAANRWQLLRTNPAQFAETAPVGPSPARALRPNEIQALLVAVEGHRLAALFHLALTLGLRMGELLGLRWQDIDFESGALHVEQQITGNAGHLSSPKTEAGRRILPLPPFLASLLQQHRQQQSEERTLVHDWHDANLVFASERGTPILPANLRKIFKRKLKAAGLPSTIRFHDLRHSALTRLAGVTDLRTVQAIAGHARAETTANVYMHTRAEALRPAVEAVEQERQQRNAAPNKKR